MNLYDTHDTEEREKEFRNFMFDELPPNKLNKKA